MWYMLAFIVLAICRMKKADGRETAITDWDVLFWPGYRP